MTTYPFSISVHGYDSVEAPYGKRLRDFTYHDVQALLTQTLSDVFTYAHKTGDLTYEFCPGVLFDNIRFWIHEQGREPLLFIRITDNTRNGQS